LPVIGGVFGEILFGFLNFVRRSHVDLAEKDGSDAAYSRIRMMRCTGNDRANKAVATISPTESSGGRNAVLPCGDVKARRRR
jgi:hypothetical protein